MYCVYMCVCLWGHACIHIFWVSVWEWNCWIIEHADTQLCSYERALKSESASIPLIPHLYQLLVLLCFYISTLLVGMPFSFTFPWSVKSIGHLYIILKCLFKISAYSSIQLCLFSFRKSRGSYTFWIKSFVKYIHIHIEWAPLVTHLVKNPPAIWETWVQSQGWEDPLEKGRATHASILAWRIPRTS